MRTFIPGNCTHCGETQAHVHSPDCPIGKLLHEANVPPVPARRLTPEALENHFALALRQSHSYKSLDAISGHIAAIEGELNAAISVALEERDSALARMAKLEEALRFYADPNNWVANQPVKDFRQLGPKESEYYVDDGKTARAALESGEK